MTERHYVDADVLATKRSEQVHEALGTHRNQSSAEALFRSLDPTTLRELLGLAGRQATELSVNKEGGNRSAIIPPAQ